jgi:hypothetical protein
MNHPRFWKSTLLAVTLLMVAPAWAARGMGGLRHGGPHVFQRFVFVDPFFVDPFVPYPVPYPYPAYVYPPPPPPAYWTPEAAQAETERRVEEDAQQASYGLVQIQGVPDGAQVDLDGAFWMYAAQLDARWLALPRGSHRLTIYPSGRKPIERKIDVVPGATLVVHVASSSAPG